MYSFNKLVLKFIGRDYFYHHNIKFDQHNLVADLIQFSPSLKYIEFHADKHMEIIETDVMRLINSRVERLQIGV